MSKTKLDEYKQEGRKDEALQKLKQYIKNGWPNNRHEVDSLVRIYFNVRDTLTE